MSDDKYRNKQVVRAWKYPGGLIRADAPEWLNREMLSQDVNVANGGVVVETLQSGCLRAAPGDWFVYHDNGQMFVLTDEHFTHCYDKVST